ncbi:MAG: hypothetical protein RL728_1141 [Bacteroidota bacterium]|jgi:pSer/pThr/pTyr-binding forkhead associated (FHA) protein
MVFTTVNSNAVQNFINSELHDYENENIIIRDLGISKKGYGQYSLNCEISINGVTVNVSKHSTDSQLYDEDDFEIQYTSILNQLSDDILERIYNELNQ